jgi:hypothetical protein
MIIIYLYYDGLLMYIFFNFLFDAPQPHDDSFDAPQPDEDDVSFDALQPHEDDDDNDDFGTLD